MNDRVEPVTHGDERQACRRHGHDGDHDDFLGWVNLDLAALHRQYLVLLRCEAKVRSIVAREVLRVNKLD